jgi:TldD protein
MLSAVISNPTPQDTPALRKQAALKASFCIAFATFACYPPPSAVAQQQPTPILLDAMTSELHRAFTSLGKQSAGNKDSDKQLPPYFLSYAVSDASSVTGRRAGALGDPKLDNTHGTHRGSAVNSLQLPLGDDREALRVRCGWPPTPATAMRSTTTCASRPRPRCAPKKKTPRPTSASRRRRRTSASPAPPASLSTARRGSSG